MVFLLFYLIFLCKFKLLLFLSHPYLILYFLAISQDSGKTFMHALLLQLHFLCRYASQFYPSFCHKLKVLLRTNHVPLYSIFHNYSVILFKALLPKQTLIPRCLVTTLWCNTCHSHPLRSNHPLINQQRTLLLPARKFYRSFEPNLTFFCC